MIDREVIESIPDSDLRAVVKQALVTLLAAQVFSTQIDILAHELLDGAENEDITALADRIKQFRARKVYLREMEELAQEYRRETEL